MVNRIQTKQLQVQFLGQLPDCFQEDLTALWGILKFFLDYFDYKTDLDEEGERGNR